MRMRITCQPLPGSRSNSVVKPPLAPPSLQCNPPLKRFITSANRCTSTAAHLMYCYKMGSVFILARLRSMSCMSPGTQPQTRSEERRVGKESRHQSILENLNKYRTTDHQNYENL